MLGDFWILLEHWIAAAHLDLGDDFCSRVIKKRMEQGLGGLDGKKDSGGLA